MSSRKVFYAQAIVAAMCLVAGMSESYTSLAWAKVLIPLMNFLPLVNVVIPFVIVRLATREQRPSWQIAGAFTLSAALTIASFFAIMPLCM
jgi:hypothetical protein